MMKLAALTLVTGSLLALGSAPAQAAKLSAADKTWIGKCVSDRKASKEKPGALRKYCVCMHAVIDNNQPFEISELERTYPPAHQVCWKQADGAPRAHETRVRAAKRLPASSGARFNASARSRPDYGSGIARETGNKK